jgi:WD40 repeat protein
LIQLWDGRTRKRLATLTGHQNCVRHVQFSPDGRRLYSAGYDGTVRTWDVQTLTEIRRFEESLR